ncbi:hypothetical protein [Brevifollis gellanilyticus]|uniref:Uncharacterized protein n=1 Tax=Brevifollis gellanilyticus TaxID=748831 RepID=A0A512M2E8_9BACT|nr:hypothetical protein [Brevifollis gellanilyticus]GEP40910.1 hypothetical protein BGE01nite_02010 [Brevifollis gellanilyticus]
MSKDIIFYQFSRSAVREGDFTDFLSRFELSALPRGRQLADMMNGLATFVNGYDADVRELYAIPEVRAFYSRLVDAWPYWLYFGNLDTEALMMVVLCCLKSLDAKTVVGRSHSQVICDPQELLGFVSRHLEPMNVMCERADLSDQAILNRTCKVFAYFSLPLSTS